MSARFKAWLAISRSSNLPTVWSNLVLGWITGFGFYYLNQPAAVAPSASSYPWSLSLLLLLLGVSCSYVGGMILNDVWDRDWDARYRPERPIPAQLIHPQVAGIVASILLILGFFLAVFASPSGTRRETIMVAALLTIGIILYNRWHKGFWVAPVVMSLCRVALPILGFFGAMPSSVGVPLFFGIYLIVLGAFTLLITWVARHESTDSSPSFWIEALFFLAPIPLMFIFPLGRNAWFILAVYSWWLLYSNWKYPLPQGVGARVANRLASLPLIDGLFLAPFFSHYHALAESRPQFYASFAELEWGFFIPSICFLLVLIWRRWIPST